VTNQKDYERMLNTFQEEFHNGCDTLRNQKDFIQSHKSVFKYINYFMAHWNRMIEEQYGREEEL